MTGHLLRFTSSPYYLTENSQFTDYKDKVEDLTLGAG